ncbi:outer membrane efflux protein [Anaeromyxobacter sp. PSR-1]|nr:outer membrane efflux protein [Anaeromyxobacter sp. PSR-1]
MQAYARHLGEGDLVASGNRFEGARLVRPITGPITPATMAAMPFDRDQLHFGAAWQIPLFAGGALVRGDRAARLAERAADAQASHALDEVRYNVRAAYRNVLATRHALDVSLAYEQALTQDDVSARLQVETEAWSAADAAKVSFALASARARRAALTAQLQSSQALLAAIMGEDGAVTYELEDIPDEPAALPQRSLADLSDAAQTGRRDLAGARAAAEAQEERAGAVRAGFWPQLALAGSYLWNRGRDVGRVPETYEVTLQLRIPILSDVGRVFAAREADAVAAQAAERARAKELEVRGQVVDALGRLDAARAGFDAGKAQRALGAEVARVEKLKLESGRGKVEDYLAARAQALEGETGYWQGLYGLQSAYDYLALVTGIGGTP